MSSIEKNVHQSFLDYYNHFTALYTGPKLCVFLGYGGIADAAGEVKGLYGISAGKNFTPNFALGAGISLAKFERLYLPATVDVMYTLRPHKTTPFGLLRAGYGI